MQFVKYDDVTREYSISREATTFLQTLTDPISVVTVAGMARGGKSTLLNLLAACDVGGTRLDATTKVETKFSTSNSTQSHTQGMWLLPQTLGDNILLMDTEGGGATTSSSTHDANLFALSLLLSSEDDVEIGRAHV